MSVQSPSAPNQNSFAPHVQQKLAHASGEAFDPTRLDQTISAAQSYLLSLQAEEGYWWADLDSNVSITAEAVLLHHVWGTGDGRPLAKAETYLRSQQTENGSWELFKGDGGNLSVSIEAYMGLRLLGVPASDPSLLLAKTFILSQGGISKSRIFTKFHLALIGCFRWAGLPSLPAWIMLLEHPFPVNIYEMSSWARGSTVPLLIVFDKKPVYPVDFSLDELYAEGVENVQWELPENGDWSDVFLWLDKGFKLAEMMGAVPFREEGIRRAEKWVIERQEATGDWGGIIPAMLNSMLALRALDYAVDDPVMQRGLQCLDSFAVETEDTYWIQPCVSPVWDTALAVRALADSGLADADLADAEHSNAAAAIAKAGNWLLDKQILDYGDWAVKNSQGAPGGWAFEFENRFYPDVDDTAVVVMALQDITLPNEDLKRAAIARAIRWIASMQNQDGGWAAFDKDNNQDWLNAIPYGDLKAMIDPSTADVTGRVLEMQGYLSDAESTQEIIPAYQIRNGLRYLLNEQEADGSWFGRWGVNYLYGTGEALSALAFLDADKYQSAINKGTDWLMRCQNSDGGWGETAHSYGDAALKGQGPSTASQTAWALLGLIDVESVASGADANRRAAIEKGIQYLLNTQEEDGSWTELEYTGTGFPEHFYLRYHLYPLVFPLMALGRYRSLVAVD
ncbi:MAG: squalene--hopene cyclase [Phormidesmis sp.]